jgi:hypothetical protein
VTSLQIVILNHGPPRTTSRDLVLTPPVGPCGIFSMAATGNRAIRADSSNSVTDLFLYLLPFDLHDLHHPLPRSL